MPNKKYVGKQICHLLEDQKQAEISMKEEVRRTAGGTLGQKLATPLVMEGNETTTPQNPHISQNEERPGLHASSLGLEELIGGFLSGVHSKASASHSSWIDTEQGVSGEESSSHVIFAGSYSYRFPCQTTYAAPTFQFLETKNCQFATQGQVSGDTETVYTGSVGHQQCIDFGGMPNIGNRNHDDTQSARYNQLLDQNTWINDTLESSSLQLGGLNIKEPGADIQSDEPLAVINYFNSMNCMHQEMGNGSEEYVTEKIVPVGNQTCGIQPATQDLQGTYENYENSSSQNIGKVQRDPRFSYSVEPYSKMTKKTRELLKKKEIQEQLDFVDNFHGVCPKLVYAPTFSLIQENENVTPLSPCWPGK